MAQAANSSVPPPSPHASVTTSNVAGTVGSGANNSRPVGGPGVNKTVHHKTHHRAHHKMYGKHYDYSRGGTKKGPAAPTSVTTGTN
jgi:hypothetical protein